MNEQKLQQVRWALIALNLVRNKLTAMGVVESNTALENLAAAVTTLSSIDGVKPCGDSDTVKLAELMRGLEIPPTAASLTAAQLHAIGAAIARQAKTASGVQEVPRG